jgi:peptidoglycan-associated lipoprotein
VPSDHSVSILGVRDVENRRTSVNRDVVDIESTCNDVVVEPPHDGIVPYKHDQLKPIQSRRPTPLHTCPVEAQATLDKQAAWLNTYRNYSILIEGHADERGTREYNIALGARRASVVVNYLVSKGVDARRITQKSFGKERPVAICDDISCWSQNRRAVTVVQ